MRRKRDLLREIMLAAIGRRPVPAGTVDRLVRRCGQHEQLVPLVRQQPRVNLVSTKKEIHFVSELNV